MNRLRYLLTFRKFEEIDVPDVEEFVYITDNTYTAQEVMNSLFGFSFTDRLYRLNVTFWTNWTMTWPVLRSRIFCIGFWKLVELLSKTLLLFSMPSLLLSCRWLATRLRRCTIRLSLQPVSCASPSKPTIFTLFVYIWDALYLFLIIRPNNFYTIRIAPKNN